MTAARSVRRLEAAPEFLSGAGHGVPGPSSGPAPGNPHPTTVHDSEGAVMALQPTLTGLTRGQVIDTDAVRRVYHRRSDSEPWGYTPDDRIGHAVLDTVSELCGAVDDLRALVQELAEHEVELEAALAAATALIGVCTPDVIDPLTPEFVAWTSAHGSLGAPKRPAPGRVLRQVGWLGPYGIVPGGMDVDPAPHWRPIWALASDGEVV